MGFFERFKEKQKPTENKCSICGETHEELPALGFLAPFYYDILSENDKNEIAELSKDFCVITYEGQTDRFVRTTLTISINGICEDLDYGIWISLSEQSFNEYKSEFENDIEGKTYFGIISNQIQDYNESTLRLHVNVNTRGNGMRPEVIPHENEHQLILDFENGITLQEAEYRIKRMEKT